MNPSRRPAGSLSLALLASLVVCMFASSPASAAVSRSAATKQALDALGVKGDKKPVRVFSLRTPVAAGTRITEAGPAPMTVAGRRLRERATGVATVPAAPVLRVREAAWLFFADRGPHQAFEHPGRVALVGVRSGKVALSGTSSWVPLIDGRLPAFFATNAGYEGSRYLVFNRPWPLAAVTSSTRAEASAAKASPPQLTAGATADERRTAAALAAEHACALRFSDTLGNFYDFGRVDWTRAGIGLFFKRLAAMSPGFVQDRYTAGAGITPIAAAQRMIDRHGCRDLLLYAAGGGARNGEPGVIVGVRPRGSSGLQTQTLTATEIQRLIRANRQVTFKLVFDAPYAGRLAQQLRTEPNVALLLTSGGASEPSFSYLPEVTGPNGIIRNPGNPEHLLEFTNRLIDGLKKFTATPAEVGNAIANHSADFMQWMLARANGLGSSPFGDHLGDPVQVGGGDSKPNVAPVLGGVSGTLAYAEDDPARAIAPTLTVADADSANLAGAAVTITGGYQNGQDVLGFVNANGITGTWIPSLATLTLTGSASVASYQAALRSVSYRNTSQDPSTVARTVTIRATDGQSQNPISNAVTRGISVTRVNDTPTVTTTAGSATYTENGAAATIDPALALADADNTSLAGARVRITGGFDAGNDDLGFVDQNGITGVFNSGTGVLTLSGAATLADYQTALRSVKFSTPGDNPSAAARTVAFRAGDSGGDGAEATRAVGVAPLDDPPVITKPANQTINEDTPRTFSTGAGNAISVADVDAGSGPISFSASAGSGTLAVGATSATVGGEGTGLLTLNGTVAQINDALDGMTYTPAANATGDDTLSLSADDGGHTGAATAAGSTDAKSLTITRTPVNDAPIVSLSPGSAAFTENGLAVQVDPALAVSDVDSPSLAGATMSISSGFRSGDLLGFVDQNGITGSYNSGTGVLTLTGATSVANYQTALRSVQYSSTSDDPGTARTVAYTATDSSAAASDPASRGIGITPVDDKPVVAAGGGAAAFTENDNPGPAVAPALTLADPDNATMAGATVQITTNRDSATDVLEFSSQNGITGSFAAGTGTLTLTGSASTTDYRTALRSITFRAAGDNPSGATRTVSFVVDDGATPSDPTTRDVTVAPVNDAPAVATSAGSSSWTEGAPATTVDSSLTVADPDSANLAAATVEISGATFHAGDVLSFAPAGNVTGTYDSVTHKLNLTGSDTPGTYETVLRSVGFENTTASPGATTRDILFSVADGSLSSNTAHKSVGISETNSKPVVQTSGGDSAFVENSPAVAVDTGVTVSDGDSANLAGATIQIAANHSSTQDTLSYTAPGGNPVTQSGAFDTTTGTLTLTGTATVAEYQAALRAVKYGNGSDTPSTATRTVRFQVDDGQSVNNLSATGASSDKSVTVTATNDAPTISVADTTPLAYTENDPATPVNASGAVSVADVDSLAITGATVAFSGGAASGDVLDATVPGGFTKSFAGGVLTIGGTGSFSQYEDILESVTYASTSDNPSSAQRNLEFVVDDGAAFNNLSTAATRRVNVANVNDAPVLTQPDGALTYTEDTPSAKHQLPIAPNLGATDADSANLVGATVKIGTNYVNGQDVLSVPGPLAGGITFTFNAASGTATLGGSASVADYQAALRSVRYQNTSDAPSENARTIEFRADDGAPAGHASNLVTRDVGVVAVNDLPVAADMTFNGADSAIGNTTFVVNDPADGAPATPDPTDTAPVSDRPHKTVAGSILAGATDADGPNPPTVVPGTFATNDGGTVTIQSDGDFTFEPAPQTSCTDTSDFFDYTLTDGNTPTAGTDTGRVTIALSGCVRYVDNDDAQGNSGTSEKPFDTLAQAQTASAAGDSIFVYAGDKTTNGYASGIDLKANQKLVGEAGALVVGADTLHTADASKRPTITDTTDDAVVLAAGNLVRGLQIDPGSAGGGIAGGAGDDGGTIEDVRIIDTGTAGAQPGLELNGTSGTFNVSDLTVDNSAATSPPSTAKGVSLNGAGTVNFLSTGTISITTKGAAGLDADTTNMGSGSVFDDITVTGSGTGGVRMSNTTGTTQLGGGSGTDLDLTTSSGSAAALRINSGGTVSVPSSGTSNVSATGGPAVDVSGTPGISLPLDGVSSTNSATNGISLAGLGSGTFSASTGAIAGAAGTAFSVSGGSGAITYPGNLDDGPGQTASITSRAGGTVRLSGQINDSSDAGGGITVSNNTGGATVFDSGVKTLNTATGTAVLFNGGDGHTLTFSNGGLNIDTTSGSGIAASGLGAGSPRNALNVTGSGNTIDSTTGTALDVARTDVGGTPLTFQSISSNGAGNGIRLDDTGPNNALTVGSVGGTCTAANTSGCSGGVIQNSTGGDDTSTLPGGTGVALRSTKGVSLTRMHIVNSSNYGIRGSSVNGLALANSVIDGTNGTNAATANKDSSARFDNLTGTVSIGDTEMSGGFTSNLLVNNTAGTLNATLTNFKSGTLDSVGGDDAVQFEGLGSATNNVTVNTSTFTTATGDLLQYIGNGDGGGSLGISGSSFSNNEPTIANGGGGVTLSGGGRNSTTLNVQNSTFRDSQTAAITVVKSRDVGHSGSLTGTIDNNAIGIAGTPNSGSSGGSGIDATTFGAGNAKLTVTNNQIYQYNSSGLSFTAGGGVAETGQFSLHISGNTIANPGTNPSVTLFQGIRVNSGVAAGDAFDTCVDMGANTIAGSGDPANGGDWRLRASFAGMRVPGATNSSPTDDAGMTSYVQGRIGSGTGAAVRANGGTWSNAGAPCP